MTEAPPKKKHVTFPHVSGEISHLEQGHAQPELSRAKKPSHGGVSQMDVGDGYQRLSRSISAMSRPTKEEASMYRFQHLALKYSAAAMPLFGIMIVAGLLAATNYILERIPFAETRLQRHQDAAHRHDDHLAADGLHGLSVLVPSGSSSTRDRGIKLAEVLLWIFCAAVAVVAAVFIFVQYGGSDALECGSSIKAQICRGTAMGRYRHHCRDAGVCIYNVIGTAIQRQENHRHHGRAHGRPDPAVRPLSDRLSVDDRNMSEDLYWWWWLVHLWVEATWEVLIGCIMALALMQLLGTSRRVVETWLYIEVGLVLGTGILGLGHHYFWIGTPHVLARHRRLFLSTRAASPAGHGRPCRLRCRRASDEDDQPTGFFLGDGRSLRQFHRGGVFGFMMTLPQINLFTHGTQWTVSHGHFAFWGAYACGVIGVCYLVLGKVRGAAMLDGIAWRWAFVTLNIGLIGMAGALLISGFAQAFIERALGGSTLEAFIVGQESPSFVAGMYARFVFGLIFAAGYVLLIYDFVTLGRRVPARMVQAVAS